MKIAGNISEIAGNISEIAGNISEIHNIVFPHYLFNKRSYD